MTKHIIIISAAVLLTGCQVVDKIGGLAYEPVVEETTTYENVVVRTPEVVDVNGQPITNWVDKVESRPVTLVRTNEWRLNPNLGDGIRMFGDVAPFPWAGTAATLLISALGVGAHAMGRRWKKVASESVQFAMDVRTELKKHDAAKADALKAEAAKRQTSNGTKDLVDTLLARLK